MSTQQHQPPKQLTSEQKTAIDNSRVNREATAEEIFNYLYDGNRSSLTRAARRLSLKNAKRWLPGVHVLPRSPQTLYVSVPLEQFSNVNAVIYNDYCLASVNPIRVMSRSRITFAVHEFELICCPRSVFKYVAKAKYIRTPNLLKNMANSPVTEDDFLIRRTRPLDACDIVHCPNEDIFAALPVIVQRRIQTYGLNEMLNTTSNTA